MTLPDSTEGGVYIFDSRNDDLCLLSTKELKPEDLVLRVSRSGAGAIATFFGTTRDNFEGKEVISLSYDAYNDMAVKTMWEVIEETRKRWKLCSMALAHRLGDCPVGQISVAIVVSSEHRKEALAAVEYAINELKGTVTIWKKEVYKEGAAKWKKNAEFSNIYAQTKENSQITANSSSSSSSSSSVNSMGQIPAARIGRLPKAKINEGVKSTKVVANAIQKKSKGCPIKAQRGRSPKVKIKSVAPSKEVAVDAVEKRPRRIPRKLPMGVITPEESRQLVRRRGRPPKIKNQNENILPPDEDSWECKRCQLVNLGIKLTECKICKTPRPKKLGRPRKKQLHVNKESMDTPRQNSMVDGQMQNQSIRKRGRPRKNLGVDAGPVSDRHLNSTSAKKSKRDSKAEDGSFISKRLRGRPAKLDL
jgi:molybdopterin synthase catalytic subunit